MILNTISLGLRYFSFASVAAILIPTSACKHTNIHPSDEGITVNVVKSSGDDFSYEINDSTFHFLSYPFNLGSIPNGPPAEEVVILSKRLNPGEKVRVQPFGKMSVSSPEGNKIDVVLSYPVDEGLQLFAIRDLYDFSSRQFAVKHMVEYWYLNRYGLNGARVDAWEVYDVADLNQ